MGLSDITTDQMFFVFSFILCHYNRWMMDFLSFLSSLVLSSAFAKVIYYLFLSVHLELINSH